MGNPDRRANSNANGNTNGVTNAYRYGDANGNSDTDASSNGDTKVCSITATAPNAVAAPVALTGIVKARTSERNSIRGSNLLGRGWTSFRARANECYVQGMQ